MTGRELRAQLRAQLGRNTPATPSPLPVAKSCASQPLDRGCSDASPDSATERRRNRALTLLADNPQGRFAVVTQLGDPVIVGIAIRGIGYGELEIAAGNYDGLALLALLERHAGGPVMVH
jgi:hypothetical protein